MTATPRKVMDVIPMTEGTYTSKTRWTQVTAKIPPRCDGRASWFDYEEADDDWVDVTGVPEDKQGSALRN